ncbi:hypothetical protein [Mesoterricola silvestris]|uniref:Uncharacterized protein n=1 Tax=Mesoterricola silvestris TaxID=2927979 RepID=A0AA48GHF2_9BACT|nr:hypothetical protein [Mesoterricola silvestris]BDU72926.1 hypothetical protein METEAL_21000 [Mesoterricola silvestris]
MGWSIGFDTRWNRDIGYGVPATCDFPGCKAEIDRGLSYVCGSDPHGGDHGCGLYFCPKHLGYYTRRQAGEPGGVRDVQLCLRCGKRSKRGPFSPSLDVPEWINHKLTDESWAAWRRENPEQVTRLAAQIAG